MRKQSELKKYLVAAALVGLSLWTFHQIFSALRFGYIYTLAIKHSAHLIRFEDSPVELVAMLVLYFIIGPVLGFVYLYINFFSDWIRPRPAPPRPRTQRDLLEPPSTSGQWGPSREPHRRQ
jgi:hypothetical protein